jgi:hypothetical protein
VKFGMTILFGARPKIIASARRPVQPSAFASATKKPRRSGARDAIEDQGTRRRVAAIFSVEFLVLGAVAGVMGSLLATGFTALVLHQLFDAGFHFDPWPNAAAIAGTALVATVTGWLASHRILGQKPLEALREE